MRYNNLVLVLFITLFSCTNSDNNREVEDVSKTASTEYLYIEGNKIAIKEYPPNGEIIFRLDNGKKCRVLEKGQRQTILNITDYWYKIEYKNVEGWVFGAQTSIKFKKEEYITQDFPFLKKTFEIFEELEYYKKNWIYGERGPTEYSSIFPLGWSKDGKIAFLETKNILTEDNNLIETYLIIQNLDTDKRLVSKRIYTNKNQTSYEIGFRDLINSQDFAKARQRSSLENCNQAWSNYQSKIEDLMENYNIIKNESFLLSNNVNTNKYSYKTKIELILDRDEGEYDDQSTVNINIYLLRSDGKRKLINKNNPIISATYGIYAYILKNPYKSIEAIVFVESYPFPSNTFGYKIIGTNLKRGFK